jgi:hypothetical protein
MDSSIQNAVIMESRYADEMRYLEEKGEKVEVHVSETGEWPAEWWNRAILKEYEETRKGNEMGKYDNPYEEENVKLTREVEEYQEKVDEYKKTIEGLTKDKEPELLLEDVKFHPVTAKEYIDKPPHYNRGKIEVIDFIMDQQLGFNDGNVVKYICRAGFKESTDRVTDLKKARNYLDKYIVHCEQLLVNIFNGHATEDIT